MMSKEISSFSLEMRFREDVSANLLANLLDCYVDGAKR